MSCASSWKPDTKRFLLDFPARLYPVLNEEYATQIARDWKAKPSKAAMSLGSQ